MRGHCPKPLALVLHPPGQVLTTQLGQLATRVAVLEHDSAAMRGIGVSAAGAGGGGGGLAVMHGVNPLFFEANSGSPQVREGRG